MARRFVKIPTEREPAQEASAHLVNYIESGLKACGLPRKPFHVSWHNNSYTVTFMFRPEEFEQVGLGVYDYRAIVDYLSDLMPQPVLMENKYIVLGENARQDRALLERLREERPMHEFRLAMQEVDARIFEITMHTTPHVINQAFSGMI